MLRSLWEHASHLTDHQGHPTNWALLEAAALALAGWRLDCFENAATWAQVGMQRLTREAQRQFLPDGAHFELSPLYQAICLEALLEVRRAVRARGRVFPEILDGTIRRGLDYLLALRRPNGTWPAHNDSWGMDGDHGALFALAEKAQDPSGGHLWDAGGIKDCAPGPAGRHFRQAGVCILGQSPGALKGNRLVFRAGPAGAAHAHDDTLSLDVSLAGQPFVVDPGISDYDAGRLAEHYRGIHAHSLPWMDGWARAASRLTWRERISQAHGDLAYAVEEDLEAATAVAWGPWSRPNPDGLIFRSVVSCGGDYFVVRDHFQGPGVRRLAVHWQFAPGVLELAPNGLVARLHGAAAMVGRLVFLGCAQGLRLERLEGSLEPLGGWVAVAGRDTPAACLTYRLTSVLPRTLVWLLWPGEAEPGTAQVSSGDQTGLVRLGIPLPGGRWDELELGPPSLAAKAPGGLRQGGVRLTRRHAGGESVILRLPG